MIPPVYKLGIIIIISISLIIGGVKGNGLTASFTLEPDYGTIPLQVNFTDTSTGSPTTWAWFFDDEQYDQAWTQKNASAGWSGRHSFEAVSLPDGSIVIMGGYDTNSTYKNDTWRSTDQGATWELMNVSSGWSARMGMGVTSSTGSIILMGGRQGTEVYNDTWRSTDQGATWELMNVSSGWSARMGMGVTSSTGSIILMGGDDNNISYFNDVWASADEGATWIEQTADAGWSPRTYFKVRMSIPEDYILLVGGANSTTFMNDTWISGDLGVNWYKNGGDYVTWSGRMRHAGVAMPDYSFIIFGGLDEESNYCNDTWRTTTDGETWTQLSAPAWTKRIGSTSVLLPNGKIILMGGLDINNNFKNDVWELNPVGSSEQNPVHTYTTRGDYVITLTASNNNTYDYYNEYANVIPIEGEDWNRLDIIMDQGYLLNITFRSAQTLQLINNVTVLDNLGHNSTTTDGVYSYTYAYGIVSMVVSSPNYTSQTLQYAMDSNKTDTVLLTPETVPMEISNVRQSTYYPHLVRLNCQDYLGNPIGDMNVTAVVVESTAPYTWLTDVFGIDTNQTAIINTTLVGTTDTEGGIVFLMVEDLKYQIQFTKPGQSINQTNYLYPKEGEYTYVFWSEVPSVASGSISIQFWNSTNSTNASFMNLGVRYVDTGVSTDSLIFSVYREDNTTMTVQSSGTPNNWNISYPVLMSKGTAYIWSIRANNTKYDQQIVQSQVIRFGYSPMKIPYTLCPDTPDEFCVWNQWVALGIIFIIAMLFGRATIKYASAIVVLLALFFTTIGWLHYEWILLSFIMFLGIMFYIRYADQESDL